MYHGSKPSFIPYGEIRSPERTAETATKLFMQSSDHVNVYWISTVGNREEYARDLETLLVDSPIVPVVWRGSSGFNNPNSLVEDVLEVLSLNRDRCVERIASCGGGRRLGIIMIARSRFELGQSASPGILPAWLVGAENTEGHFHILDLSWRLDAPLSAQELTRLPDLHTALHRLEAAIVRRLIKVNSLDSTRQCDFFNSIKRGSDVSWDAFLASALANSRSTPNAAAYRPSRRNGLSTVARLWAVSQGNSSLINRRVGLELEKALALDGEALIQHTSLFSALRAASTASSFGENLISAVTAACEVITLEAHAENAPEYPIDFLALFIEDVFKSLISAESALNTLDPFEIDPPANDIGHLQTPREGERFDNSS